MNADMNAELTTPSGMTFEKYKELSQGAAKLFDGVHAGDIVRVLTVLMAAHTVKNVANEDELHEAIATMAEELAETYRDSCLALSGFYTAPEGVTIQ